MIFGDMFTMRHFALTGLLLAATLNAIVLAQAEVRICTVAIDASGRVQVQVPSSSEHYYVLYRRFSSDGAGEQAVSMTLGGEGTTSLTEPLGAHGPDELYRVMPYRQDAPADTDGDGIDDMTEILDPVRLSPLNPAPAVAFRDGVVFVPDRETFQELSYQGLNGVLNVPLENWQFMKFIILDADTDRLHVYSLTKI